MAAYEWSGATQQLPAELSVLREIRPRSGRRESRPGLLNDEKPFATRATLEDWFRAPAGRGRPRRSAGEASNKSPRRRECAPRPDRCRAMPSGRNCGADEWFV